MIIRFYVLLLGIDRKTARVGGLSFYCAPKPCKRCGDYLRNAHGACLECKRADNRQWRNQDEDFAREYMRNAMRRHRSIEANRLKSVERAKRWKQNNPEIAKRSSGTWNKRHPGKAKESRTRYYQLNKLKFFANVAKRRARLNNAEGFHTDFDLINIMRLQNGMCKYCEERSNLHLDHKIPISRGGSNWPANLQYLCQFHNLSKWTKTDSEYRLILKCEGFNVRLPE